MKILISLLALIIVNPLRAADLERSVIGPLKTEKHIFEFADLDKNAKVSTFVSEGMLYLRYDFNIDGNIIHADTPEDDLTIFRISTTSKNYKTSKNAHVGMTLNELRTIYPDYELIWQLEGNPEAKYSFVLPNDEGVFEFSVLPIEDKCGDKINQCQKHMGNLRSISFFTW